MIESFICLKTNLVNKSPLLDGADERRELSVQLESPFWSQHGVINISYPSFPSFPKFGCKYLRECKAIGLENNIF